MAEKIIYGSCEIFMLGLELIVIVSLHALWTLLFGCGLAQVDHPYTVNPWIAHEYRKNFSETDDTHIQEWA